MHKEFLYTLSTLIEHIIQDIHLNIVEQFKFIHIDIIEHCK